MKKGYDCEIKDIVEWNKAYNKIDSFRKLIDKN